MQSEDFISCFKGKPDDIKKAKMLNFSHSFYNFMVFIDFLKMHKVFCVQHELNYGIYLHNRATNKSNENA